jgi:hypothetical protein
MSPRAGSAANPGAAFISTDSALPGSRRISTDPYAKNSLVLLFFFSKTDRMNRPAILWAQLKREISLGNKSRLQGNGSRKGANRSSGQRGKASVGRDIGPHRDPHSETIGAPCKSLQTKNRRMLHPAHFWGASRNSRLRCGRREAFGGAQINVSPYVRLVL